MSRLLLLALTAGFCLSTLSAVSADEAEPKKKQKLTVSFKVPSSAEKATITEVRQVGKELWVRVDVTSGGIGAAVISTVKPEATVEAPALPIKYLVFGKKWSWKNEEKGITFLADQDKKTKEKLEKDYEGGKVVYKAKKGKEKGEK